MKIDKIKLMAVNTANRVHICVLNKREKNVFCVKKFPNKSVELLNRWQRVGINPGHVTDEGDAENKMPHAKGNAIESASRCKNGGEKGGGVVETEHDVDDRNHSGRTKRGSESRDAFCTVTLNVRKIFRECDNGGKYRHERCEESNRGGPCK